MANFAALFDMSYSLPLIVLKCSVNVLVLTSNVWDLVKRGNIVWQANVKCLATMFTGIARLSLAENDNFRCFVKLRT